VCHRNLTPAEENDLIRRFTVPDSYTQGSPSTAGTYFVVNNRLEPGGWVTTAFPSTGVGTNTTTPFHVFSGTVVRQVVNTPKGASIETTGYGGYGRLATFDSGAAMIDMAPIDFGELLDALNDAMGPGIFNGLDKAAAAYAKSHYPGC
jgi:hypothetical protein